MRKLFLTLSVLTLSLTLPGRAQEIEAPPRVQVMNSNPSSVWVVPGGKMDTVRVYGRGFELVRSVNVQRHGGKVSAVTARLRPVSQGMADLEVKAAGNAEPGNDYQLIFVTGKETVPVELKLEVVSPEQ